MATKAELEAELAELKTQLAKNTAEARVDAPPPGGDAGAEEAGAATPAPPEDAPDPLEVLPEGVARDLARELEHFAKDQPVVVLAGVFLLGYLLGRTR